MKYRFSQFSRMLLVAALFCGVLGARVPVQAKPRAVKMDRALRRQLNTFFSNFSEASVAPFRRGRLSDERIIWFAVRHQWMNHSQDKVPVARVDALANWYFGRKIQRHSLTADSAGYISFRNGIYKIEVGEGDPLPFSQIATLTDLGNGEFAATTNDYETHEEIDFHGPYSPQKNARVDVSQGAHFTGKHKAVIKRVGAGKTRRFILLEYQELSAKP